MLGIFWPALLGNCAGPVGPRLDPRPLALFGGGDAMRIAADSRLVARRCEFAGTAVCCIFLGIEGTGGASAALGTGCDRDGEGSLKVLSDIDPELPLRSSCDPKVPRADPAFELPIEDVEPVLRSILLVWTSATDVGVVGKDRNAAAAAADDSDAFED
jgi:hypothetical protein